MIAEIISCGTELLLGQIVDTNASYLARTLAGLGVDLYYKSTVGDNEARMLEALSRARDRADLIITSGGLGPTEDDLTKECVAQVFDEELVIDPASLETLEQFWKRRGISMPARNRKQALIYRSGRPIPNPNGTAPGALLEKEGKLVVSLPGPPNELQPMVENHLTPLLTDRLSGVRQYLVTRTLRFVGIGESAVEEKVADLLHTTNPTVAPLAHTGEVHLRLAAKASGTEEALKLIAPVESEIRRRVGQYIYAVDNTTLEQAIVRALIERELTFACAESCTGGMLGSRVSSVPGSSAIFLGGVISYSNEAKRKLLGVPDDLLVREGAVSGPVATAMAEGALRLLGADYAASITGVAGPDGGTDAKPVGLVYTALAGPAGTVVRENRFFGLRETIRHRSTSVVFEMLRDALAAG